MPGFDGTGPMGRGPLTGRGLGPCGRGFGRGFRGGFGRGFGRRFGYGARYYGEPVITKEQEKEILESEMKILQEDIEAIKKRIKELD